MRDIIILDTSIFIKENFLHGNKIKSLINLSKKGEIDLYITEITYEEILINFKKCIDAALSAKKTFDSKHKVLKNISSLSTFFSELEESMIMEQFKTEIDNLINEDIIKKIPYTSLNIGNVFKKYFNTVPPFSDGNKKAEFPDAFSIELIKKYFEGKQLTTPIKVFSTDRDFLNCNENNLSFSDNYEDYINNINLLLLLKRKEIIIQEMFEDSKDEFENEFKSWFEKNLDDVSLYYGTVIFTENIYDIEIEKVIVNDLQYKIIDINDDIVTIEVYADVFVSVDILKDDEDTMYYDSDDKEYHYLYTKNISIEKTFKSSMISTVEIISEEDFSDFEIESINEDLTLDFNTYNHYE